MSKILIVDDEIGIRELLSEILEDEGYGVLLAENAEQARKLVSHQDEINLILLDIWMPDTDGITLLKEWVNSPQKTLIPPVIMMSGHGTIDTAVEATKIGAISFLEKPISLQKLLSSVKVGLEQHQRDFHASRELNYLEYISKSSVIEHLTERLKKIVHTNLPLLLVSEPGCGAEIWAKFLHQPNTPWVIADTSSMLAQQPMNLLDQARKGVLFIPEVGNLNKLEQKGLQLIINKLARYQTRLICATTSPLIKKIEEGSFDRALYNALGQVTLTLPALREHKEDIPEIAKTLLRHLIQRGEVSADRHFVPDALGFLTQYDWLGNLPELENAIRTLALNATQSEIKALEVQNFLQQHQSVTPETINTVLPLDLPLREARDAFERIYFEYHLQLENYNMSRIAEKVGLERTHLYRKIKQLGIKVNRKSEN